MAAIASCGCNVRPAGYAAARPAQRVGGAARLVVPSCRPMCLTRTQLRRGSVMVRADSRNSESSFVAGFVLGGVVFGALGFIFAPQISKAVLGDDSRLKLPRFLEDEAPKDPEATKQDLIDKIAQLNASIDEVAATLKTKESTSPVNATEEAVKVA